jgi:hypothetical protein
LDRRRFIAGGAAAVPIVVLATPAILSENAFDSFVFRMPAPEPRR